MSKLVARNFVSWNRRWTTIRRHLPVILKPAIVAIGLILIWRYILFPHHWYFAKPFEPILFIVLPLTSFIYVIFASVAVGSVFDQYRQVSKSVVRKDVDTFLLYRDEQLPILMHILIGAPSLLLLTFVMLFDYDAHTVMAIATIGAVSFMLMLIWVIVTELDDFRRSIWFQVKIPQDWYEINIDDYFSAKKLK